MSSSSSSIVNKRKRLNPRTSDNRLSMEGNPSNQQSTSGEEADAELSYDSAPTAEVGAPGADSVAGGHPAKRAKRHSLDHNDVDEGDKSSTTEASSAIQGRVRDGRRLLSGTRTNSSASSSSTRSVDGPPAPPPMAPPEKGGTLAPAGYSMNPPPTDRPVRVYADGVFDLFHLGHMRQLEQAKKAFPNTYLLVGIPNDTETHKRKGLTVLTDQERAETLRHCKWVDEVIENAPWIVSPEFLDEHSIDYVAHDDEPYASADSDDIYRPCKEAGKFLVTQRTEGISTTYIITKIVRDYEKYIIRQLKRGTSRQELNVSWLKKNELDLKRHVTELRETIKNNWSTTGRELRDEFRNYWAPASPRSSSPYLFGTYGGSSGSNRDMSGEKSHLSHLEPPSRPQSPHTEFANGYSLGLIGGVRSWMRARQTPRGSMAQSEASSDDEDAQSPPKEGQEKRLQDSIQNDIKSGEDEAVSSGNKTAETPVILKTSP
ncbi:cytidylyltransferase-domain-containing protein [Morchella snyderi]|nr:cytidylyltransferase-domain-containing protein [Morchella snyderi]